MASFRRCLALFSSPLRATALATLARLGARESGSSILRAVSIARSKRQALVGSGIQGPSFIRSVAMLSSRDLYLNPATASPLRSRCEDLDSGNSLNSRSSDRCASSRPRSLSAGSSARYATFALRRAEMSISAADWPNAEDVESRSTRNQADESRHRVARNRAERITSRTLLISMSHLTQHAQKNHPKCDVMDERRKLAGATYLTPWRQCFSAMTGGLYGGIIIED